MATTTPTLRHIYDREAGERETVLETARECARLTDPGVLPDEGHTQDQRLHENYQSIGAWGSNNLEGKMLTGLWPALLPWFKYQPSPQILYNPNVSPQLLEVFQQRLFLRELLTQSVLESAGTRSEMRGQQTGFRSTKRKTISQLLITGDTLEKMDDEYQIHLYRRDQYVTRRDSAGNVLFHCITEMFDPLTLSDEELSKVELKKDDIEQKDSRDRQLKLFTYVEWQPRGKNWVIEQETNDHRFRNSDEKISQFFSTPYKLTGGEHYGRGFIERQCRGDLSSFDALMERVLDWAGAASKVVPAIDENSNVKPKDLAKPSGQAIRARVTTGQIQDVAFLQVDKLQDFTVVQAIMRNIEDRLGRAMLIGSASVRDSERTTAAEYRGTIAELDGALGGVYAPIADFQQVPLINRTVHQLERDRLTIPLPKEAVEIQILTGISALARSAKVGDLLDVAQAAQLLGPEAMAKIDSRAFIDVLARYKNIYEPAVIKSNQQLDAEQQAAEAAATRQAATQEAIRTSGAVVEANLQPQNGPLRNAA